MGVDGKGKGVFSWEREAVDQSRKILHSKNGIEGKGKRKSEVAGGG